VDSEKEIRNSRVLAAIPKEHLQRDCPNARFLLLNHGATIYQQGEISRSIYCLLSGQVVIYRISQTGEAVTTAALGPGDFFGPFVSGSPVAENSAKAKGEVMVWCAPLSQWQSLLNNHPEATWQFCVQLAARHGQMERRLESFAFKKTEARLAQTLRDLSGGFATRCNHGFGVHLRLSQQELADLVGATRPVVSAILNRLRSDGVLAYNREYICVRGIDEITQIIDS